MRNSNGMGGVVKLSGNRRRPFWVRITDGWELTESGKAKQVYKTVGYYATKKEALIALANYHQNPVDLTSQKITFEEVYEIWSEKHFEEYPSSTNGLRAGFKRCEPLHKMKMVDIKTVHLKNVMDAASDVSVASQTKLKMVISRTFKYCLENDILTKDYSEFLTINTKVKSKKSDKFFTDEDLAMLFGDMSFNTLTDTFLILLHTGMRITEMLDLRVEHIDLEKRIIDLQGTKTEAAKRLIPIHKDIIDILDNRICHSKSGFLIETDEGERMKYDNYRRNFYLPWMEKHELKQTIHATRHTFVSLMDRCGVPSSSVTLKRIVGHANGTVTDLYTHKMVSDLIAAIDKLSLA